MFSRTQDVFSTFKYMIFEKKLCLSVTLRDSKMAITKIWTLTYELSTSQNSIKTPKGYIFYPCPLDTIYTTQNYDKEVNFTIRKEVSYITICSTDTHILKLEIYPGKTVYSNLNIFNYINPFLLYTSEKFLYGKPCLSLVSTFYPQMVCIFAAFTHQL